MRYLVDANVLSEPTKPKPDPHVVDWLQRQQSQLAVDPIVLGELRFGILSLPRGRRRAGLERWFAEGARRLRCIAWDEECGLRWAELLAGLRRSGQSMPIKDSLIATTALVHGLTVATRNGKDFEKAMIPVMDPFIGPDDATGR